MNILQSFQLASWQDFNWGLKIKKIMVKLPMLIVHDKSPENAFGDISNSFASIEHKQEFVHYLKFFHYASRLAKHQYVL